MAKKRGLGRGLGALIPGHTKDITPITETKNTPDASQKSTRKKSNSTRASVKQAKAAEKETKTAATRKKAERKVTEPKKSKEQAQSVNEGLGIIQPVKRDASSDKTRKQKEKSTTAETVLHSIQHLALDQMEANPDQPRKDFNEQSMAELTESIRTYGVLQPIVIEKFTAPGHAPYRIIAGERRYRAAKQAGLTEVPVVLRADHPEEQMLLSVVENVQRQDLTPVEEAVAYQHIMEERHMTQQELSTALGKSRPYIANAVRLLRLDDASLEALREGKLTSSQGRTLLAEKDLKKRAAYLKLLTEGKASVKEVENRRKKPKTTDAFLADVERRFSEALETNVVVVSRRKGWSVQIACYNKEELNRLLERLGEPDQH